MRPFLDVRGVVELAKVEPAVERLEAQLERGRRGWLVHEQLSRLRRMVGDLAQAETHLDEAVRSRPSVDTVTGHGRGAGSEGASDAR